MARATRSDASDSIDAISLLTQDHRLVSALFDEVEDAEGEELETIAERVCLLLTIHAKIEEEILYPQAREVLDDEDLVAEAEVEHQSAKELIAKLQEMTSDDDAYKATVTVLGEYVDHHVKEEENEMFPKLRKSGLDLKEIGAQLQSRRLEMLQELGIEADVPEEMTQQRAAAGARAKGKRKASGRSANR
jgi:hemerythrin superfamily protein